MVLRLFGDSDGSSDESNDISKIEINKEFARRYEHNKKREDLQRLDELKKKGVIDDSEDSDSEESSDEFSEDDGKKDLEFFNALLKVKNKDPVLKNKEAKLFESESEDEIGEMEKKGKKKEKPMYLKDVTAKHLIEEGPEFDDREEEEEDLKGVKSYSEEQEELRKAFFEAVETDLNGDDNGEELFKVKESANNGMEDGEDEDDAGEVDKKLDEYFGNEEKLDENSMFLKDYFRNKMWLDKGDSGGKVLDEEDIDVSEDEEEVERQEDYEREFNFRFEENPGERVMGHSRVVEGSVRKKTNARKLQRERKEERMARAEFERKEELKHLKNLKKKEINEKLRKIRKTAGIEEDGVWRLDADDLEEEFDPEEYDRKMKEAFDDDYYEANDVDPEFGSDRDEDGGELEKPDFDKEDELFGLPKGWDDMHGSGDGFEAARERILKQRVHNEEEEEVIAADEGKKKKKCKRSHLEEEVLNKELDEYYKLDYEDSIGDLKTRFKYRPVNAKRYGLNTKEVLLLDDKELNQHVPLKKLAPYREKEWKVPRIKIYNQKLKIKSILEGEEVSDTQNNRKRKYRDDDKSHTEESNGDINSLSKSSKRRHRQAPYKLSQSRLMAYGKIPSKPKSKKKQ